MFDRNNEISGLKKYCDIMINSKNIRCNVHENFKCIMVVDR